MTTPSATLMTYPKSCCSDCASRGGVGATSPSDKGFAFYGKTSVGKDNSIDAEITALEKANAEEIKKLEALSSLTDKGLAEMAAASKRAETADKIGTYATWAMIIVGLYLWDKSRSKA